MSTLSSWFAENRQACPMLPHWYLASVRGQPRVYRWGGSVPVLAKNSVHRRIASNQTSSRIALEYAWSFKGFPHMPDFSIGSGRSFLVSSQHWNGHAEDPLSMLQPQCSTGNFSVRYCPGGRRPPFGSNGRFGFARFNRGTRLCGSFVNYPSHARSACSHEYERRASLVNPLPSEPRTTLFFVKGDGFRVL